MSEKISLKPNIEFGVVPTHIRFVGGLAPNEEGKFPRNAGGELIVVAEMKTLRELSPVKITCVQVTFFPGSDADEIGEMIAGLRALDLEVHLIIMVGGVNPMDPADEDATVAHLVPSLKAAAAHGVTHVSSTSIEEWMRAGELPRNGAEFDAAVAQNVRVHLRVYEEAGLEGSSVENWHIEFLRPGEFKTFTSAERGWKFVAAANQALGKKFFKLLVDAAHCGDSGVSIAENQKVIADIAAAGELGIFHCSAKTTRGCLSTDDGWVGALLASAAATGELKHVFVEFFDHADPALQMLRDLDPGHGVDTRDGRSYTQVAVDGLVEIAHRLNNLAARGILKA